MYKIDKGIPVPPSIAGQPDAIFVPNAEVEDWLEFNCYAVETSEGGVWIKVARPLNH